MAVNLFILQSDAPMQSAYVPMSKNGCIKEKERPAANLLAVSKKATVLFYLVLNPRSSGSTGINSCDVIGGEAAINRTVDGIVKA
jgi:hypothetical protein